MSESYSLTILPSAARTALVSSSDITDYRGKYADIIIDVTAVTATPGLTITVQGKAPISGKYYTLLESAAITSVSTNVLRIGPGQIAAANTVANVMLPRVWRVSVAVADTDSATYSIEANISS